MRLSGQFMLAACGAAVACAGAGTWLLRARAAAAGAELLDGNLRTGQAALERQWVLRRAERRRSYEAIAAQSYFRAYLLAQDRPQMEYFAGQVQKGGAAAVVIEDPDRSPMAQAGAAGPSLAKVDRQRFGGDGQLYALDGMLVDVVRLPIGGDRPAGFLTVAAPIEREALRTDAGPFGVEVALAGGEACVATLDEPAASELCQRLLGARGGVPELSAGGKLLRVRADDFAGGRLLTTVPLDRLSALTSDVTRSSAALLALFLVVTVGAAFLAIRRIARPIRRLQLAADHLRDGDLEAGAESLSLFAQRSDELGALSRALAAAAAQLATSLGSSFELSRAIEAAIGAIDSSAESVSSSAARQEHRVREIETTFEQLAQSLEASVAGFSEADASVKELLGELGGVQRAVTGSRTSLVRAEMTVRSLLRRVEREADGGDAALVELLRELNEQIGSAATELDQQRASQRDIASRVSTLRLGIDRTRTRQVGDRYRGDIALRAISEAARVARDHASKAGSLLGSTNALRREFARLRQSISR